MRKEIQIRATLDCQEALEATDDDDASTLGRDLEAAEEETLV